ncbi:MAG: ChaN family lipoprotein [Vicinamibacterales bacterium]
MTQLARMRVIPVIILVGAAALSAQSYVPQRVFDSTSSQFSDFESMVAAVAKADVVLVGEQHDDPNTHRLERALLDGLARRRGDIIVSLEMFERDVQSPLDQFRSGKLAEAEFLALSRPWPRYGTDYKPLVDLAVERQWPVLAANIPRPIAAAISKGGLDVLKDRPAAETAWFARDWQCPADDEYYRRFKDVMGGHTAASDMDRFYSAQCLKDETMSESIAMGWSAAAALKPGVRPLVVHFNGSFHSDFGLGTAARVKRRMPNLKTVVVTMIPVADLDAVATADHQRKGDFVVFTVK